MSKSAQAQSDGPGENAQSLHAVSQTTDGPRDLPGLAVRRPYLAIVLNLLIVVAGLSALAGIEVRELPDVDRPVVSVRATYPGASPETIDAEVTAIIEGAVARVNGINEVRASSEENNLRVRLVFNPGIDLIDAANEVREAVARVERDLPDEIENLSVIKADNDAEPIVRLSVFSDVLPIEAVTRRVEDEIIPALIAVPGVADIRLRGEREQVVRVVVDPARLARFGLSIGDVSRVLESARFDVPAGSFPARQQEVLVRADASVTRPEAIEALILRDPVRIGDVAHVHFGPADATSHVRLDNRTVVNLGVIRRAQSNTVEISDAVAAVERRLNDRYDDLTIVRTSDEAVFIKGAIGEVLLSLSLAIGIVVGIIAVFSGQLRTALIPAVAIPVALIGTLAAIWILGFSINLVTLLALVLAAGLVVDDAIVVLENIQRLRARGMGTAASAMLGTQQVYFAVLATTATLVSVFIPISFLPSSAGRLFAEFGVVLAVAVAISSFVALTLCPVLASRLPVQDQARSSIGERAAGWIGSGLKRGYGVVVRGMLAAPLIVLGLAIMFGVAGMIAYERIGEELVPREDRGKIRILLTGPDGTGIDYIDRQVERVEAILRPWVENGTITSVYAVSGRWDPNRGWIEAPLSDWSERVISEEDLARKINAELRRIPGARARVLRGNSLGLRAAGSGLKFALIGNNYAAIFAASRKLADEMEANAGEVENVRIEFRATQPQVSLRIDRRRASDLGVSLEALAATVRALVDEDEVAELTVGDQRLPVVIEARAGAVDEPSDLNNLFVTSDSGRLVALSQLITFEEKAVAAELDRHGQRRAIEISADLTQGTTLRDAVSAVRALAATNLPPGIGVLLLDEAAQLDETSHGVALTYAVAAIIVFLVLVAQFESVTSAAVVLATVPFGMCAAVFALLMTGTTLNIYSQIGVLMLMGIMAKNAILMVEFADQLRERGVSASDAALEASMVRLRPIAMTMISTVLAGLPLILGDGPGAEARAAIGWVVVGGLGMSAMITLCLTPALYSLIAPLAKPRGAAVKRLENELADAVRRA